MFTIDLNVSINGVHHSSSPKTGLQIIQIIYSCLDVVIDVSRSLLGAPRGVHLNTTRVDATSDWSHQLKINSQPGKFPLINSRRKFPLVISRGFLRREFRNA